MSSQNIKADGMRTSTTGNINEIMMRFHIV